jgi:tetratricopeptide (TPR) repeat protein
LLGKALRLEQDLAARNPGDAKLRQELGNTYEELSLHFGNPYALTYILGARQGLDYAYKALEIRDQLYREGPNDPGLLFDLFEAYHYVADDLWLTGHLDQALDNEMKIRSMMVDFIDRNPTNAEAKRLLVTGDGRISRVLEESGQLSEALARLEGPFQGIMSLGAADPKNILVKRQMSTGYNQMGELLLKLGKVDRAIEYHRKAVQLIESVLSVDTTNPDSRNRLANTYQALGNALAAKGQKREAAERSSVRQSMMKPRRMQARQSRSAEPWYRATPVMPTRVMLSRRIFCTWGTFRPARRPIKHCKTIAKALRSWSRW